MLKEINKKDLENLYNFKIKDDYKGLVKFKYSESVREYDRVEEVSDLEYLGNDLDILKYYKNNGYEIEDWLEINNKNVEFFSLLEDSGIDNLIFKVA